MWLPPQVSASALEFPLRSWLHFNELEFSTLMKIILFQVRKSIPAIIFLFANALVYNNFFLNLNPQDAFFFFFLQFVWWHLEWHAVIALQSYPGPVLWQLYLWDFCWVEFCWVGVSFSLVSFRLDGCLCWSKTPIPKYFLTFIVI